jgi:hypothetical protein
MIVFTFFALYMLLQTLSPRYGAAADAHSTTSAVSDNRAHAFLIVFVRGSGSTWLQALLNDIEVDGKRPFHALNEPELDVLHLLDTAPRQVHASATFVGAKSKVGQLDVSLVERIANGTFGGRVVFLHRVDAFAHTVSVCRKKLSPLQNAVAFAREHLTAEGVPIDEKLFEVQARELDDQREQLRTLANRRDIGGFTSLHIGYEAFLSDPRRSFRRLVAFLTAGTATQIDDAALARALNATNLPLKNTRAIDTKVVPNLVDIAAIAQQFAFMRPFVPAQVAAQVQAVREELKNETLLHKVEREQFYDARNRDEADKFFDACSNPPAGKKNRPMFHCRIMELLAASRDNQVTSAELASYFASMKLPSVAACIHFAAATHMVSRWNTSSNAWQLKEHLHVRY